MAFNVLAFLAAGFGTALCLVPVARWLAVGTGLVARPDHNRWSRRPVGKLGGIAMAMALGVVVTAGGLTPALGPLILTSGCMLGVGFLDDLHPVGPVTKLILQMSVTAMFIYLSPPFSVAGHPVVDPILAFLWVLGLTNAFNLLDNIDGLAAGIAAITAMFLTATLLLDGTPDLVPLGLALAAFAGVALGFLIYNFHPATIFMGDSGSHLLGFAISASTLLALPHLGASTLVPAVVTPILILLIPIFDTTFVTITRGLSNRSIFAGGRDHTSHRLVALGIGERRAVFVLYVLAIIGGAIGLSFHGGGVRFGWGLAALYAAGLIGLGIYLGHVDAMHPDRESGAMVHPLPSDVTSRYRGLEVALDALLIGLAYYLAIGICFQEWELFRFLRHFAQSLPLVLLLQLAGLALAGKYRQPWRSLGPREVWSLLRGTAVGAGLTVVAVVYLYGPQGFSRAVFLVDAALLPLFVVGARYLFRVADDYLRHKRAQGKKALVVGAGRGGALALRELLLNPDLGCVPLGFVDDDEGKQDQRVEGYRVLGTIAELGEILQAHQPSVALVIVAIGTLSDEQFAGICSVCDAYGVDVRRLRFSLDAVAWRDRKPGVVRFQKR